MKQTFTESIQRKQHIIEDLERKLDDVKERATGQMEAIENFVELESKLVEMRAREKVLIMEQERAQDEADEARKEVQEIMRGMKEKHQLLNIEIDEKEVAI